MRVIHTKLKDCVVIEPKVFSDDRGYFLESFHAERYRDDAGINCEFVQDNISRSCYGTLRGLHFQINNPQGKLVTVLSGEVFDVVVDIRKNSETFGQYESFTLSEQNKRQLWVPPGFAHGFQVLSDFAQFYYKCTDYYHPNDEGHLIYNDPSLKINWPITNAILSIKDAAASSFEDFKGNMINE